MRTTRPAKNKVQIQFAVPRRGLPSAALFRSWLPDIAGITVRIVGRREGALLNRKFRGKSAPTNVLTFATGDIVLCDPVIRREARSQGKSLAAHYAHLVVHGVLHLQGYDHVKKRDAARMEAKEIRRLRRLGFGNPYE